MIIPIRLAPVELHIHADRWLAFEVLSAFGARQDDGGSSAVLKDEGVEGPLQLLRDRFTLHAADGCTRFRYESTIGLEGAVVGWLRGQLLVRPILGRFTREHSRELKKTIEARALKSRLYPPPSHHARPFPGQRRGRGIAGPLAGFMDVAAGQPPREGL